MIQKKWLYSLIIWIILASAAVYWNNFYTQENKEIKQEWVKTSSKKVYNHTFAQRIENNNYFKWEFISNDVVSVYPRRDALVKDILVDIWDKVQTWDTLAILFNPWIPWEAQSKINIKDTIVDTKNKLLHDAQKVKEAKIKEIDQKIAEKEIILTQTSKNYDSKISQVSDIDQWWSQYQVTLKWLENLQKNLENAQNTRDRLLLESEKNILQKSNLLDAKINEIYNKIIPIIYIWNQKDIDYNSINSYDFSDQFWAKDSMSRNIFITDLKAFHNNYQNLSTQQKYDWIWKIITQLIQTLHNTIISLNTPESEIQKYIWELNWFHWSLLIQKELLEDAQNSHEVLSEAQKEKIENLELQIWKTQNELSFINTQAKTIQSEKDLILAKLKEEIQTLQTSKQLLIASENKTITTLENEISIAKADLQSQYIQSGDYKIISPFSGVISKRSLEIWEKISTNWEVFRISWVNTSLAKITKKEIKFYVPEHLKDNISLWNQVSFSVWNENQTSFTGSIYRISPEVDSQTLSIIVQAKVDENLSIAHKSTVRVGLTTQQDIFQIPSSTIYNKDDRKIVYYKKENGKLWVRDINIISNDGEYSLVTWNIDETLKIVTTPIFIK